MEVEDGAELGGEGAGEVEEGGREVGVACCEEVFVWGGRKGGEGGNREGGVAGAEHVGVDQVAKLEGEGEEGERCWRCFEGSDRGRKNWWGGQMMGEG